MSRLKIVPTSKQVNNIVATAFNIRISRIAFVVDFEFSGNLSPVFFNAVTII